MSHGTTFRGGCRSCGKRDCCACRRPTGPTGADGCPSGCFGATGATGVAGDFGATGATGPAAAGAGPSLLKFSGLIGAAVETPLPVAGVISSFLADGGALSVALGGLTVAGLVNIAPQYPAAAPFLAEALTARLGTAINPVTGLAIALPTTLAVRVRLLRNAAPTGLEASFATFVPPAIITDLGSEAFALEDRFDILVDLTNEGSAPIAIGFAVPVSVTVAITTG